MGEVLIDTLKKLSNTWNPELENAWTMAYNEVAAIMAQPSVTLDSMVAPPLPLFPFVL